jgi:hypothetical protein
MPETPTPRVLQATWDWRARTGSAVVTAAENLRSSALLQGAVMGLVGAALHFGFHHFLFARIVWGLAVLVVFLGLFIPAAYRPLHAFGRWLGRVVGQGLTYLLLVPFFFLFFLPVAWILRLQGRDPLHRDFRDSQWTYWIARSIRERGDNIDKQFLREDKAARGDLRPVGSPRDDEGSVPS